MGREAATGEGEAAAWTVQFQSGVQETALLLAAHGTDLYLLESSE